MATTHIFPSFSRLRGYTKLAAVFRTAKYVTVVLLAFFLLLTVAVFRSELTLENLRFLLKFFDSSASEYAGSELDSYRDIYFDATSEIMLGLYNDDLAVVKGSSIDIYNMSGSNTLSHTINYARPVLLTSSRYMLTYGLGENSYIINNSFTVLNEESFEYPVTDAALSDAGIYAVATRTLEYKGILYVYDENFRRISTVYRDKYILDVDITPRGDRLLMTSVYNEGGIYHSELLLFDPYSEEPVAVITLDDAMAVRGRFNSTGGFTVICAGEMLFYDKKAQLLQTVSFGGELPTDYCFAEDNTLIVFNENAVGNQGHAMVYSPGGDLLCEGVLDGRILDIAAGYGCYYLLYDTALEVFDTGSGVHTRCPLDSGCLAVVPKDQDVLLVCYTNRASAYSVSALLREAEKAAGSGG